ncbi:MAG: DUF2834 domain-containing protein [Pseudomonadaceae bacterium]|nr:DUF2834 domain-containing protein [Pseudomonadaceae bacterium]
MRNFYLAAAILGAVVPYAFFISFFLESGVDVQLFVAALFANGAAGGFTADILISSAVFWTYMFSRRNGPKPWLFIVLNLSIGLSCALPAYLYSAARHSGSSSTDPR